VETRETAEIPSKTGPDIWSATKQADGAEDQARSDQKKFEHLGSPAAPVVPLTIAPKPRVPEPGAPVVGTFSSAASSGAFQTLGQGTGISRGITNLSTLSSGFPTVGLSMGGQGIPGYVDWSYKRVYK
jgi:hypothetical protein